MALKCLLNINSASCLGVHIYAQHMMMMKSSCGKMELSMPIMPLRAHRGFARSIGVDRSMSSCEIFNYSVCRYHQARRMDLHENFIAQHLRPAIKLSRRVFHALLLTQWNHTHPVTFTLHAYLNRVIIRKKATLRSVNLFARLKLNFVLFLFVLLLPARDLFTSSETSLVVCIHRCGSIHECQKFLATSELI